MIPWVLSGLYRSGTTVIWRVLMEDPRFTETVCEPLHPDLGVQQDTYPHYYKLPPQDKGILNLWRKEFHNRHLWMETSDRWPELERYISALLKDGALLKFTRLGPRLSWFLSRWGNRVKVINLVRDPRAVALSYLKPYLDEYTPLEAVHGAELWYLEEHFQALAKTKRWASELGSHKDAPSYVKVLALWKVWNWHIWKRGLPYIRYEDFAEQPRRTIKIIYADEFPPARVMDAVERNPRKAPGARERKWYQPVDSRWAYEWRAVPHNVWEGGIEAVGIEEMMEGFGYANRSL